MARDINRTRRENNRTSCFLSSTSNENADFSSDLLDNCVVTINLGMCCVFIICFRCSQRKISAAKPMAKSIDQI